MPVAGLLPRLGLEPEGLICIGHSVDVGGAIAALERARRLPEAARLAAHALAPRDAVWWACVCARAVPDPTLSAADEAALDAAEAWVRHPDETSRRACMAAAEPTGFRSPEAWAAVAAFWSGGSLAPEGEPLVPPAEHLRGVAVAGAVALAAVRLRPDRVNQRFGRFIGAARDIAVGGSGRIVPETD